MDREGLLRRIPRVDTLCRAAGLAGLSPQARTQGARLALEELRRGVLSGRVGELPGLEALARRARALVLAGRAPGLRPVLNCTGVVLHTNLGRAPLSRAAVQAAAGAAGYCTLEYDLANGRRGSRQEHVEGLLCRLTGAQAALAVNNNAAAVLLAASALAAGRQVVASRGELVEIGGSFRLPEVLRQGGAQLREVGATNRTRLEDYARAITPQTALLLKVHPSNYRVVGFTSQVPLEELCRLGHSRGLPVAADLGSGLLLPAGVGLPGEPRVAQAVAAGADVVAFSGDKLLGGPQAGLLVGRRELIQRMRAHPLARAVRLDKLNLAALEATLRLYLEPGRAQRELPVARMLTLPAGELEKRARWLLERLAGQQNARLWICRVASQAGGGALPGCQLPSWALAAQPLAAGPQRLEQLLRRGRVPDRADTPGGGPFGSTHGAPAPAGAAGPAGGGGAGTAPAPPLKGEKGDLR